MRLLAVIERGRRQTSGSLAFIISDSFIITGIGYDRLAECVTAASRSRRRRRRRDEKDGDKKEDE